MTTYEMTYASIVDIANVAGKYVRNNEFAVADDGDFKSGQKKFFGVSRFAEAESLAVNGWDKEAATALEIAESAVELVEQEHPLPAFSAYWDVTGSEVDVARYLSGEPENMIDYEMIPTPRNGRVITLCASVSVSAAVSTAAIKRRGHVVAALAFALNRMGYAVELWADASAKGYSGDIGRIRVLVKGPNDELDTGRIMFAYSHPAFARGLCLPAMHAFPSESHRGLNIGASYGQPVDPAEDMPEGTIYLPSVCSDRDVPNADEALTGYLRLLGIITD